MLKIPKKEILKEEEKLNKKFSKIVNKIRNSFLEEMDKNNFSLLEREYCSTIISAVFIAYNQYFLIDLKLQTENKK